MTPLSRLNPIKKKKNAEKYIIISFFKINFEDSLNFTCSTILLLLIFFSFRKNTHIYIPITAIILSKIIVHLGPFSVSLPPNIGISIHGKTIAAAVKTNLKTDCIVDKSSLSSFELVISGIKAL